MHLVDWHTIAQLCENDGLRVTDLLDMKAALLTKWVYTYANDRNYMWWKVVCAKSGTGPSRMLLDINRSS